MWQDLRRQERERLDGISIWRCLEIHEPFAGGICKVRIANTAMAALPTVKLRARRPLENAHLLAVAAPAYSRIAMSTSVPALPAIGILEPLSEDARRALASAGEIASLPEGTSLLKQGDQQDRLFFLLEGKLCASCRSSNSIVELGMIMPGESVGEMNVIDPKKASADVKAARTSRVWSISKVALDAFMEKNPVAGMQLMRALAAMLCQRIRKSSDRMLRQAEMAYAVYEWLD